MAPDDSSGARPAPVVLRIKLRYDDLEAMIQRFAPNVGKTGLFLPTKSIQPVGTEIKFELRLSTDQPVLVGLGRVKAARDPDPDNPRATFGIAVELMRVTRESRDLILKMLERRKQLGLAETGLPMPADIDAARRADFIDTGVKDALSGAVPQLISATDSSPSIVSEPLPFTAPRRPSGPIAVARVAHIEPLAPEPPRKQRPPIADLIANLATPIAGSFTPDSLDDDREIDVAAALTRARALAQGTGSDLDHELDALLEVSAAPLEIGIEAASAELARQLGGAAVRRDRRGRTGGDAADDASDSKRWSSPPPTAPRDSPAPGPDMPVRDEATREAAVREGDACEGDAREPDTREPDAREVDAREADAREDDAREVDAREPATREAGARQPDAHAPATREAAAREPDAHAPATREAGAREPDARERAPQPDPREPRAAGAVSVAAALEGSDTAGAGAATRRAAARLAFEARVPRDAARDLVGDDANDDANDGTAGGSRAYEPRGAGGSGIDDDDDLDEPTPVAAIEPAFAAPHAPLIHDDADVSAFATSDGDDDAHEVEPDQIHDEIHQVDDKEFEEVEHTQVGAVEPSDEDPPIDPFAFEQHAFATMPADHVGLASRLDQQLDEAEREDMGLGAFDTPERAADHGAASYGGGDDGDALVTGVEDEQIEEIEDFEILAEADAADADLLGAMAEHEVGHHGAEVLGPETTGIEARGPETLGSETLGPETLGSETLGPETLGPETLGSERLGIEALAPETLAPEAFADALGGYAAAPYTRGAAYGIDAQARGAPYDPYAHQDPYAQAAYSDRPFSEDGLSMDRAQSEDGHRAADRRPVSARGATPSAAGDAAAAALDNLALTPDPEAGGGGDADEHGFELPHARPSFLSRLELDDDSGYHTPLAASHFDESTGDALRGFEDSEHGLRRGDARFEAAYGDRRERDDASEFGGSDTFTPPPRAPYPAVGEPQRYTFANELPAEDGGLGDDFDAPHGNYAAHPSGGGFVPPDAFDQSDVISIRPDVSAAQPHKRTTSPPAHVPQPGNEDFPDLESALEALDVDLDDLGAPHAAAARRPSGPTVRRGGPTREVPNQDPDRHFAMSPTEDARARKVRTSGPQPVVATPARPPPAPRPAPRPTPKPWDPVDPADEPAPKRAATDDGIVIDFDED